MTGEEKRQGGRPPVSNADEQTEGWNQLGGAGISCRVEAKPCVYVVHVCECVCGPPASGGVCSAQSDPPSADTRTQTLMTE